MAVFMGRWKESEIAMFSVYFDGSGSPSDTPIVAVAGFLATPEQWIEFERNWQDACVAFGVSGLHMRDYAHSKREFEPWKRDVRKRQRFLERLINIIQTRVRNSFASAVVMSDSERMRQQFPEFILQPYALTGCTCIRNVQRWAARKCVDPAKISYLFEDGDRDRGQLAEFARKHQKVNPIFLKKEESVAFQAADLLAYEYLKGNKKIHESRLGSLSVSELRAPLRALEKIPNGEDADDWGIHDSKSMVLALEMDEAHNYREEQE